MYSCAALRKVMTSSSVVPPSTYSFWLMRKSMAMLSPTASRTAFTSLSGKRMRFSKDPPYSSVRWLVSGEKNALTRLPCAPWMSTMSKPASRRRTAALQKRSMTSSICSSVISSKRSGSMSGVSHGTHALRPASALGCAMRPACRISHEIAAPYRCTSSTRRCNPGMSSSL